jgi:hypothetical protein
MKNIIQPPAIWCEVVIAYDRRHLGREIAPLKSIIAMSVAERPPRNCLHRLSFSNQRIARGALYRGIIIDVAYVGMVFGCEISNFNVAD